MASIILVPTDFSENAALAAHFALGLARKSEANVCFLHVFTAFRSAFQGEAENEADRNNAMEEARQQMDGFMTEFDGAESKPDSVVSEGHLADEIDRMVAAGEVIAVVMGTTGASGLKYHVLGSNTFAIANRLRQVPLIVVPPATERFTPENVGFFTDFNSGDQRTLTVLASVFPKLADTIQLVHFGREEEAAGKSAKLAEWSSSLAATVGLQELPWRLVAGEGGNEAIEKLGADFDLLALTLVERGFFERLFSKSMARELVHQSKVPVFLLNTES